MQQLVHCLDGLIAQKNKETNRLESSTTSVVEIIQENIKFLNKQIQKVATTIQAHIEKFPSLKETSKLLVSIPVIGDKTTAVILAFINEENFTSAKQVAAFVGLNPKLKQSGTSVNRGSKISKTGNAQLRKAFYMPAIVAIKWNPIIQEFAQRLTLAGKAKMKIVIAAMRKLIHISFGVLKNKMLFRTETI